MEVRELTVFRVLGFKGISFKWPPPGLTKVAEVIPVKAEKSCWRMAMTPVLFEVLAPETWTYEAFLRLPKAEVEMLCML